jgi:hypothetical protein
MMKNHYVATLNTLRPPRLLIIAGFLTGTVLVLGCWRASPAPEPSDFGGQWRRWSAQERNVYVSGFLAGASTSQRALCNDFEPHILSLKRDGEDYGSGFPCTHFEHRYSHVGIRNIDTYAQEYVQVLNDFYKHPECRVMPYSILLEHMDDKEFRTGDQMFNAVQVGELHLGFLSGFDGMERCYGAKASTKNVPPQRAY